MTRDAAIVVDDLTYTYGDLVAVDRVSFDVGEGEILGFLGPNGAGKTTTVKMLTGQLKPKSGRATLLGMDVAWDVEKVQGQIGVCFETTNLYEQMSALDNLNLFAGLYGVRGFDAAALLGRVGLGGREKDRVDGYSKGMKQRLMVARALVNHPKTRTQVNHQKHKPLSTTRKRKPQSTISKHKPQSTIQNREPLSTIPKREPQLTI